MNSRKPFADVAIGIDLILQSETSSVLTQTVTDRSGTDSKKSLRKEVIQPQVPLRLPCYDLVPVTEPSVDTTVMWRLRPFPAPMT